MSWTRFSSIIFRNVVDREEGSRLGVFAVAGVRFLTAFRSAVLLLTEETVALRFTGGDPALDVTFNVLLLEETGAFVLADVFVLDVLDERLATEVELFFVDFPAISSLLFSRNRKALLLSPANMNKDSHRFATPKLQKIAVQS